MSYLRYMCLLAYSGVQHILCCFLFFFLSSFCVPCVDMFLQIAQFLLPLGCSLTFIHIGLLVMFMLPHLQSSVLRITVCPPLLVFLSFTSFLAIVSSFFLRITASDYPFGILKLFFYLKHKKKYTKMIQFLYFQIFVIFGLLGTVCNTLHTLHEKTVQLLCFLISNGYPFLIFIAISPTKIQNCLKT